MTVQCTVLSTRIEEDSSLLCVLDRLESAPLDRPAHANTLVPYRGSCYVPLDVLSHSQHHIGHMLRCEAAEVSHGVQVALEAVPLETKGAARRSIHAINSAAASCGQSVCSSFRTSLCCRRVGSELND